MIARSGWVFVAFFISGYAALVYQIAWQRILALFSGADAYSVTMVVSAFMGGLGLGSLVAGHVADCMAPGRQVLAFAATQAATGLFGLASTWIFYDLLYHRWGGLAASPGILTLVLFVGLLCPTFCMGASLPFLARALVREIRMAPRTLGALYAANSAGAALGALSTTWILIHFLGLDGAIRLGAILNLVAVVATLPASRGGGVATPQAPPREEFPDSVGARSVGADVRLPLAAWIGVAALAGFCGLALEIVWIRFVGVLQKSSSFTFGHLVAIVIGALAAGAVLGRRLAPRCRRSASVYLALQAIAIAYAVLAIALFVAALGRIGAVDSLWAYAGSYEPIRLGRALPAAMDVLAHPVSSPAESRSLAWLFLVLYGIVPVIGPATFAMGMGFPFLQKAVLGDVSHVGRRLGWLVTANVLGSMAGSWLTGIHLLATAGTSGMLRVLAVLAGVFLLSAVNSTRASRAWLARGLALAGVAALALAVPNTERLWAKLHGTTAPEILVAEDASGVSLLKSHGGDFHRGATVFAGGSGQSGLPYGGGHTILGMLPAMLHPSPGRIAIIGLGSGNTLYAAAGREESERLLSIEIVGCELDTLRAFGDRTGYAGALGVLEDPRIEHVVGDGRLVLRLSAERFDIIEADALRPRAAYAGALYSREYFELVKERLAPGGFAVTWCPTERTKRTFSSVFPEGLFVAAGGVDLAIGSDRTIEWDLDSIGTRLGRDWSRGHYSRAGIDPAAYLALLEKAVVERFGRDTPRPRGEDLNTDLFPRDEYFVPE